MEECFHFGLEERRRHEGEKRFQVVLNEVHDDEDLRQRISYNDFPNPHNVLMPTDHQCHDFPQRRDGKSILFLVELELLERDDFTRSLFFGTENDTVRAFFDVVEPFVLVDGATGLDWRMR